MKINRRSFISIFGLASLGGVAKLSGKSDAVDIDVNRFENNKKISLQNIHSTAIKMKEVYITSNNIDYSKNANLSIYASIEDQNLGKVKSKNINLKSSGTELNDIIIHLDNPSLFDADNYKTSKTSLDINLRFELDHPSIDQTITENVVYKLNISASGELESHTHRYYNNFNKPSDNAINKTKFISGSNLSVLTNKSGFNQVKSLVENGTFNNSSSYTIPPGVIDLEDLKFRYSSPRDYRNISNDTNSDSESFSGSDLSVLTSKSGFNQVKLLVKNGTITNSSSYTIPPGVIDLEDLKFRYSSPRDYRNISNDVNSNSESFSGSDLSVLTSKSGFNQVKSLVENGTFNNSSSYTIPSGVIDLEDLKFRYSSPRDYRNISNDTNSDSESFSGSDLSVLTSKSGFNKVKSLVKNGTFNNSSSYAIPSGVIDLEDLKFRYSSPRDYRNIPNKEPNKTKYHLS